MIEAMHHSVPESRTRQAVIRFLTYGTDFSHNLFMEKNRLAMHLRMVVNSAIKNKKTTHKKMVAAKIISNGQLGELRSGQSVPNVGLETLDQIAKHLKMQPWQVLHPDFDASAVPSYSAEAIELAQALDAIGNGRVKAWAYAVAMQVLSLNPAVMTLFQQATAAAPLPALPAPADTPSPSPIPAPPPALNS